MTDSLGPDVDERVVREVERLRFEAETQGWRTKIEDHGADWVLYKAKPKRRLRWRTASVYIDGLDALRVEEGRSVYLTGEYDGRVAAMHELGLVETRPLRKRKVRSPHVAEGEVDGVTVRLEWNVLAHTNQRTKQTSYTYHLDVDLGFPAIGPEGFRAWRKSGAGRAISRMFRTNEVEVPDPSGDRDPMLVRADEEDVRDTWLTEERRTILGTSDLTDIEPTEARYRWADRGWGPTNNTEFLVALVRRAIEHINGLR